MFGIYSTVIDMRPDKNEPIAKIRKKEQNK